MRAVSLGLVLALACGAADAQQVFRPGHAPGWRPGLSFLGGTVVHAVTYIGSESGSIAALATGVATTNTTQTVLANDLLIQGVEMADSGAGVDHNPPCPSGYTFVIRGSNVNTAVTGAICAKRAATNGETTAVTWPTWTGAPSNGGYWYTTILRGSDLASLVDDAQLTTNGDPSDVNIFMAPSVTATATNDMMLVFGAAWRFGNFTPPAGQTQVLTNGNVPSTRNTLTINTETLTASGATGTRTFSFDTFSGGPFFSLAIKPN